jgi:hypothetical protein
MNSRRTTEPSVGGVVGQDGRCAVMCRLSLSSASRAAQYSHAHAANTTVTSHNDPATASSFMSPELAKLFLASLVSSKHGLLSSPQDIACFVHQMRKRL